MALKEVCASVATSSLAKCSPSPFSQKTTGDISSSAGASEAFKLASDVALSWGLPSTNEAPASNSVIPCKALKTFGFSPVNRGENSAAAMNAVAMLREKFGDGPITFWVPRSPPTDSEYIENMMFDYICNSPYPWLLGSHRCIRLRKKKKFVRLPNMFRCSAKKVFSSWVKR